ncbi:hypothetical protein TCAL_13105 [Tigriopus californicus]|uniref:Ceramide transfer protein n=1 Tax=Tigriopus californicus TaxID=6832 RepID=A0A553NBM8_TIGCA|nr:ceramide transfer protein-like [Tigriopus californicus]TRY62817.1 hypothetical protein TCAL_13105 [Tigriopus californicus]|eukprot:TCALIF_13105-PA protein Name:"Similar to COL4A3BP Collagen type IV alpha-3-binding protein (Cricetulus griseus)" AED:0.02 eAED:0.02 QI:335/1/1/1/0.6/0.5/6/394/595
MSLDHHLLSPNHSNVLNLSPELSDDEDFDPGSPEIQGTLSKWTNYIHGWQNRFFVLKDGNYVYYRSEHETDFGCRGAISVQKAKVKMHALDEKRFDVSVNDCVWYLRAESLEDRQRWVDALDYSKTNPQWILPQQTQQHLHHHHHHPHENNLRRHGSGLSLTSSIRSNPKGRGLPEKLAELETYRDILCRQVDTLQAYFDSVGEQTWVKEPGDALGNGNGGPVDFKGEAITFKATTAGILATLSNCIEIMNTREEAWKKKLDKEHFARKIAEDKYKKSIEFSDPNSEDQAVLTQSPLNKGPDFEEGPHSQIGEDEFYDAVENALDKLEEEQQYRDQLKMVSVDNKEEVDDVEDATKSHSLWPTIDEVTKEQLYYARLLPGNDGVWELFAQEGEMRMYKREEEVEGRVVDPLKALHQVKGVTARELCHYFFSPDVRMEWETTLEHASVIEKVSNDTLLFLQLHKRIWPTAQRDACFWSHLRKIPSTDAHIHDTYLVCNKSVDHPTAPENQNGVLRVDLTVIFVCDTIIDEAQRSKPHKHIRRQDITTKITYCSVINPGGWAPAAALRTVYKREYPRFLKRFTSYVIDKCSDKPIMW